MYIYREFEKILETYLSSPEIIAVIGPRQAGKTTVCLEFLNRLKEKFKINTVSFDDPNTLLEFEEDIELFIEKHVKKYDIVFIDEVQYAKNSGKRLKYIYDKHHTKIIISGSSAAELSLKSAKYLVGRIFIFELFPLSFTEYLQHNDRAVYNQLSKQKTLSKQLLLEANKLLGAFILWGGYPRVCVSESNDEKNTVMKNIVSTYLLREIKEILHIQDELKVFKLMKLLAANTANIISYNEIGSAINLSFHTLKERLNVLEKTYIVKQVRTFSTNKKTETVKSSKLFFVDTGFRNNILNLTTLTESEKGKIYENFVFSELTKLGFDILYWRTKSKAEVDFVINHNGIDIPVEVKSNLPKITRSLRSFVDKYSPPVAFVVNKEKYQIKEDEKTTFIYLPFVMLFKLKEILSKQVG